MTKKSDESYTVDVKQILDVFLMFYYWIFATKYTVFPANWLVRPQLGPCMTVAGIPLQATCGSRRRGHE
jgi:hypothetical protein